MSDVVVRRATLTDVEELVGGYEWLFEPPGARPPQWDPEVAAERLRRAISGSGSVVFMAVVDGQLCGLCTVYDDIESVRFGRGVWVEDLAVDSAQRSRGIGKQLLDAARAWGRERGATRLQLTSGVRRLDAHRFYEREQPDTRSLNFGWNL